MRDDEDLNTALRDELAARTPPPPRSGLPEVVARGHRRRRMVRLATALAAVAAVAGTTFAATTLAGGTSLPPAETPTATPTPSAQAPWPEATVTGDLPECGTADTATVDIFTVDSGLETKLRTAIADVADREMVPLLETRHGTSHTYTADLADGTGSVLVSLGQFFGTPRKAADEQVFDELNCDLPKRHELRFGHVLQLYPVRATDPSPSLSQTLRIYRPGGLLITVEIRNYGTRDHRRAETGELERTAPDHRNLPLSERQLAEVGVAIMSK